MTPRTIKKRCFKLPFKFAFGDAHSWLRPEGTQRRIRDATLFDDRGKPFELHQFQGSDPVSRRTARHFSVAFRRSSDAHPLM
jgi:hypothetical protein